MSGHKRIRSRLEPPKPSVPGGSEYSEELSGIDWGEDCEPQNVPETSKPKRKFKRGDLRLTGFGRLVASGFIATAIVIAIALVLLIQTDGVVRDLVKVAVFVSSSLSAITLAACVGEGEAQDYRNYKDVPVWFVGVCIAFVIPVCFAWVGYRLILAGRRVVEMSVETVE